MINPVITLGRNWPITKQRVFLRGPQEREAIYETFTSARLETKKYFTIVTTNASFCLLICAFVFASNSGHFRINDFLLFFTPLLLLNYFVFNFFLFLQKRGALKPPQPLPLCGPWERKIWTFKFGWSFLDYSTNILRCYSFPAVVIALFSFV